MLTALFGLMTFSMGYKFWKFPDLLLLKGEIGRRQCLVGNAVQ
jgi:hypothetical protein